MTTVPPVPPLPQAHPALQDRDDEDPRAPHILVARYRKAKKVAQAILSAGGDAAQAEALGTTELGRSLAAQVAGSRVPSETTWALVVELVREVRP